MTLDGVHSDPSHGVLNYVIIIIIIIITYLIHGTESFLRS